MSSLLAFGARHLISASSGEPAPDSAAADAQPYRQIEGDLMLFEREEFAPL